MQTLTQIKVNDIVNRNMGLNGPIMSLKVTQLTADRIVCGDWEFDRSTGAEIDELLGWGPEGTGTWIVPTKALA